MARRDIAQLLRLSRVETIFQADVVLVALPNGDLKIAKHDRTRPEVKIPAMFNIRSIVLEDDGRMIVTITPEETAYDGKDKIRAKLRSDRNYE